MGTEGKAKVADQGRGSFVADLTGQASTTLFDLLEVRRMARASPVFAGTPAPTVIAPTFRFCARQLLPQGPHRIRGLR